MEEILEILSVNTVNVYVADGDLFSFILAALNNKVCVKGTGQSPFTLKVMIFINISGIFI